MKHIKTLKIITTTLFAGALFALSSAHAATPTYVSGVPIATFCASYAKNEQTKFVAITVVLKIKEQPAKKAIYMRQYQTFLALGKQYCKGYVTTAPAAPAPAPVVTPPPSDGYFTGFDGTLLAGLSNGDRAVISGRIEQGKQSFTSIVQDLINKGRLVESDKQEMQWKISFKFSENCNQLDGKILVKQWYNANKQLIKSELMHLYITINLCFSPYYESHYEEYLQKIIYHELGHYYSYFHDTTMDTFTSICRTNDETPVNVCNPQDFVSSYATSLQEEDYAETFAYYMLDGSNSGRPILQQKIDYFKAKD